MTHKLIFATLTTAVLTLSGPGSAFADGYPIAGATPYQRPVSAPTITRVQHNSVWYAHALTGITQPYPGSLRFLENQGNWYTPFNHPGMTGPYDIRGWHR